MDDVGCPLQQRGITGRREQQLQYQSEASPVDVRETVLHSGLTVLRLRGVVVAWPRSWHGVDIDNKTRLHFLRCNRACRPITVHFMCRRPVYIMHAPRMHRQTVASITSHIGAVDAGIRSRVGLHGSFFSKTYFVLIF